MRQGEMRDHTWGLLCLIKVENLPSYSAECGMRIRKCSQTALVERQRQRLDPTPISIPRKWEPRSKPSTISNEGLLPY